MKNKNYKVIVRKIKFRKGAWIPKNIVKTLKYKREKNVKLIRNDEKFGGFGNKEILNLIIRRLDGRKWEIRYF